MTFSKFEQSAVFDPAHCFRNKPEVSPWAKFETNGFRSHRARQIKRLKGKFLQQGGFATKAVYIKLNENRFVQQSGHSSFCNKAASLRKRITKLNVVTMDSANKASFCNKAVSPRKLYIKLNDDGFVFTSCVSLETSTYQQKISKWRCARYLAAGIFHSDRTKRQSAGIHFLKIQLFVRNGLYLRRKRIFTRPYITRFAAITSPQMLSRILWEDLWCHL